MEMEVREKYKYEKSDFKYSDEWLIRSGNVGHLAIKILEHNGESLFVANSQWELGHKSVSVDILTERSGIYAIPVTAIEKNVFYSLIRGNPLLCLVEYEDEDVRSWIEPEKYKFRTCEYKDELLIYAGIMAEVGLQRCNIIYEAYFSEFYKGNMVALERFKKEKERLYWINKFKTINPYCEKYMGNYA